MLGTDSPWTCPGGGLAPAVGNRPYRARRRLARAAGTASRGGGHASRGLGGVVGMPRTAGGQASPEVGSAWRGYAQLAPGGGHCVVWILGTVCSGGRHGVAGGRHGVAGGVGSATLEWGGGCRREPSACLGGVEAVAAARPQLALIAGAGAAG